MKPKRQRRRGGALVDAVLDAAWVELTEVGYANFTIEGTARRAHTSRPVLIRRWPTRKDLVFAAIKHQLTQNPLVVPDVGDTRAELISLLTQGADRGVPVINLMMLRMSGYLSEADTTFVQMSEAMLNRDRELLQEILNRGVRRGDLDPQKLTPRVVALLPDLCRHEMITTLSPVPSSVIASFIDEVFLPLARKRE